MTADDQEQRTKKHALRNIEIYIDAADDEESKYPPPNPHPAPRVAVEIPVAANGKTTALTSLEADVQPRSIPLKGSKPLEALAVQSRESAPSPSLSADVTRSQEALVALMVKSSARSEAEKKLAAIAKMPNLMQLAMLGTTIAANQQAATRYIDEMMERVRDYVVSGDKNSFRYL